ncbi:MAG: hypothetical protein ACE5R6_17825 [Candidatus Heimdallarchaeota archaeon]
MIRKIKDKTKQVIDKAQEVSKTVTESIKCPTCNGTGIVGHIRKKPCKECGGTGNIVGKIGQATKEKIDAVD